MDTDKSGLLSLKEIKSGIGKIRPILDSLLTQSIHKKVMRVVAAELDEITQKEFDCYIMYLYNYLDFFT